MGYVTKTLWNSILCAILVVAMGCSDSKKEKQNQQKEQTLQDSHNTRHNAAKPNIVILATGGTIAGAVDSSLQTTGYQAGVLSIESLLQSVPELASIAHLEQKEQTLQDSHNTRHNAAKPNIVILATGGTIAGAVDSSLQTTGYQAGVLSIESLLQSVPELASIAHLESEQIANIDSADMSDEIWLRLAKRVNTLLKNSNVE